MPANMLRGKFHSDPWLIPPLKYLPLSTFAWAVKVTTELQSEEVAAKPNKWNRKKHTFGRTLTNVDSCSVSRKVRQTIVSHNNNIFLVAYEFSCILRPYFSGAPSRPSFDPVLHTIPGVFWHGASIFFHSACHSWVSCHGCWWWTSLRLPSHSFFFGVPSAPAWLSLLTAKCSHRDGERRRSCHSVVKCFCTLNVCPEKPPSGLAPSLLLEKRFLANCLPKCRTDIENGNGEREHPNFENDANGRLCHFF